MLAGTKCNSEKYGERRQNVNMMRSRVVTFGQSFLHFDVAHGRINDENLVKTHDCAMR